MTRLTQRLAQLEARARATATPTPRLFVVYEGDGLPADVHAQDRVIRVVYEPTTPAAVPQRKQEAPACETP